MSGGSDYFGVDDDDVLERELLERDLQLGPLAHDPDALVHLREAVVDARLDPGVISHAVFEHTGIGATVSLQNPPSEYLREKVWIPCDPDEQSIPHLVDRFGDRFMWASDFPHPDHTSTYILDLDKNAGGITDEASRATFLGGNARELFDITV